MIVDREHMLSVAAEEAFAGHHMPPKAWLNFTM
jgi:hypothetical protein